MKRAREGAYRPVDGSLARTETECRSNSFKYEPHAQKKAESASCRFCFFLSVREKIRTPDLLIRSQTLYPAELRAHFQHNVSILLLMSFNVNQSFKTSLSVLMILSSSKGFVTKSSAPLFKASTIFSR